MQSRKAGWPKGRITHEHSSRFNQAWKQLTAIVFDEYSGRTAELPIDHFRCTAKKDCSGIVRIDSRGFAVCEICGSVYNDGWTPPPKNNLMPKDFFKACKADQTG